MNDDTNADLDESENWYHAFHESENWYRAGLALAEQAIHHYLHCWHRGDTDLDETVTLTLTKRQLIQAEALLWVVNSEANDYTDYHDRDSWPGKFDRQNMLLAVSGKAIAHLSRLRRATH